MINNPPREARGGIWKEIAAVHLVIFWGRWVKGIILRHFYY